MAMERLPMRKIREILRLKLTLGLSHRATASSLGVSVGAVGETARRAKQKGLSWDNIESSSDDALETLLYGIKTTRRSDRPLPDFEYIHQELRRPGVTKELLHMEYLENNPDGYQYSAFCTYYREWQKRMKLSMRQTHRAGEKMFVDYSGKKPTIVEAKTGEAKEVELFVAVLGASSLTYAEATHTQRSQDWIMSHVRSFEYFEGTPALIVPDQLRSGVSTPDRYEPQVQRTYEEMAAHYNAAVLPARSRKPKDKAKVEVAVQIVQRWILACLRNETFFSLEELNERIWDLLENLNNKPMRNYKASRRELFESIERAHMKPLAKDRFVYAQWKVVKVNIDYHIEFEGHFYSVPYQLLKEQAEVRATATTVEIYHKNKRIASHKRSFVSGRHTTVDAHMPKSHRSHLEWTPTRLIDWAGSIGPSTQAVTEQIFEQRRHPEQGYRSVLGLLRLAKQYNNERLEGACNRMLQSKARCSYRSASAILKNGLDRIPFTSDDSQQPALPIKHDNVRGADYYNQPAFAESHKEQTCCNNQP